MLYVQPYIYYVCVLLHGVHVHIHMSPRTHCFVTVVRLVPRMVFEFCLYQHDVDVCAGYFEASYLNSILHRFATHVLNAKIYSHVCSISNEILRVYAHMLPL
jgi:hypothetical protein